MTCETPPFPFYDQIGNDLGYVDETGAVAAAYDYDAYGNLLDSTGPLAAFFRHRFSTKLFDPDIGFCYYGYRWYSPAFSCSEPPSCRRAVAAVPRLPPVAAPSWTVPVSFSGRTRDRSRTVPSR